MKPLRFHSTLSIMCNLYDVGPGQNEDRVTWEKEVREAIRELPKQFNLRPTDLGLVVLLRDEALQPEVMRWGFKREFNPALTNARDDKLSGRMWNKAWRERRRCVIAMSAFYEWSGPKGHKQTHAIERQDQGWMWAAGLWEPQSDPGVGDCYTMITTSANAAIEPIHDRMPAFVEWEEVASFLSAEDPLDLIRPFAGSMHVFDCENPLKMRTPSPPIPQAKQGELL